MTPTDELAVLPPLPGPELPDAPSPPVELSMKRGYYDGYIIDQMTALKDAVSKDWDGILYVCGRERCGKTTFAQQLAVLLDPSWTIDRMCWSGKQFRTMVLKANKNECIVLDEAYTTFAKARRFVKLNDDITSMLTMIGKKNLFIIIVAPLFWQMSEYLMVHRTCAMYRVYSRGEMRGFWELYGFESKEQLYYRGKQWKSFSVYPADRRGRFGKWTVVDKDEYDKRKEAAIQEIEAESNKKAALTIDDKIKIEKTANIRFLALLNRNQVLKWGGLKAACQILGITDRTIYNVADLGFEPLYPSPETPETNYSNLEVTKNDENDEMLEELSLSRTKKNKNGV
jgi:hypothetical protein